MGAIVLTILNCLFTFYGTGRHITVQKPQWVTPSLKVSYCVRLVYLFVLATTKIGVLTLYRRVFDDRKTRNIIWGMMAAVVLYTTPVILMYLFQCRPIYGVWESSIEKTCLNTDTIIYVAAGCSIAVDIALVVVAIPRIRKSYFCMSHNLPFQSLSRTKIISNCVSEKSSALLTNNLHSPAQAPPSSKSCTHRHRLPQHPRHHRRHNPLCARDRHSL